MRISSVGEGVYLIDTMALGQKATVGVYLVKDRKNALIDCGYASSYMNVLQAIGEVGVRPEEMHYIIPTHVHLDHGGATGHLAQVMKNAEVIAHEKAAPHLVDPERLVTSATEVFGKKVVESYGLPLPVEQSRIRVVGEEMQLSLGKKTLVIMHAPGHAPHQVSVSVEGTGILVTADSVGIIYPDVKAMIPTTPPPSFDPGTLISTLKKLGQNSPKLLLMPHFGARSDAKNVFEKTEEKVIQWVERVREMRNRGYTLEQIQNEMERSVMEEAGLASLPPYARLSIRTSLLGIMKYLEKAR